MHIEINTDNHVRFDESVERHVQQTLENTLSRFAPQLTRVEVHLHDTNADKGGARDKHCLLEAKLEGRPPLAASDDADTLAALGILPGYRMPYARTAPRAFPDGFVQDPPYGR